MPDAIDAGSGASSATPAYQAGIDAAQQRITDLEDRRSALLGQLEGAATLQKPAIQASLRSLETELSRTYRDLSGTLRSQGNAQSRAALVGGNNAAYMKAEADIARADALEKRADAYAEGQDARRAQLEAEATRLTQQARVSQAQADVAAATTPQQIQQAQVALDQARAAAQTAAATAAVAPRVAEAGDTSAEQDAALKTYQTEVARATTPDEINAAHQKYLQAVATTSQQQSLATQQAALASVAPDKAQADLRQAQANADLTRASVEDAQRRLRQAPSDSDAARSIQLELQAKQAALDTANQQLDLARRTADATVAQVGANVASTQAGTQSTLQGIEQRRLGTLYGIQDRMQQVHNLLSSGQIDPAEATQLMHDYTTTAVQGTTPFELGKFQTETATTRRGQDAQIAAQKMSDYTSGLGSVMREFNAMNAAAPPGSDVAGRGFLDAMNMFTDRLNQYGNLPAVPESPLLRSIKPGTGTSIPAMASPQAVAPAPTSSGGHQITINIGGGGGGVDTSQTPALLPPGVAGTTSDPRFAGLPAQITPPSGVPAMLQQDQPATPDHVASRWDPSLVQAAMQRMTAQDAQARAAA